MFCLASLSSTVLYSKGQIFEVKFFLNHIHVHTVYISLSLLIPVQVDNAIQSINILCTSIVIYYV